MNILEIKNLNKSYANGIQALSNFNMTIQKSGIFSLLGENGAGKSTLIKILTTVIKKDSGRVKVLDYDLDENPMDIRKKIASVSQDISIDTHLSLEENMLFQSRLYHMPRKEARERMLKLIDVFELHEYKKYPVRVYSGGVQRRLDIAMTMMSNPEILFLDEPTVGMDIKSRKTMWKMIKKINKDFSTTVLLTTHYLEEADYLSDQILIMKHGKDLIFDSPSNLKDQIRTNLVEIQFEDKKIASEAFELIEKEFGRVHLNEKILLVDDDFRRINYFVLTHNIDFIAIRKKKVTIEEVFLDFNTSKGGRY